MSNLVNMKPMRMRKLGNSGLEISPIAFGAWAIGGWMWGGADKKDAMAAIHESLDLGMTTIDTAPVYGFGQSEEIVGEAVKGKRDKVQLLTKFGLRWNEAKGVHYFDSRDNQGRKISIYRYSGKESVIKECEESLKRLKTDYIDLLQIHWPDTSTPVSETMEAIKILLEQGKIRAAGVCNYDQSLLSEALQTAPIISNQVPYSMVRRDIEQELIPYCIANNVGILAYSPLQRGLLTGKFQPNQSFNEGDSRPDTIYFKPENIKRTNEFLDSIGSLARDKSMSLAQLALRWTIEQKGITCALAGARDPKQVRENAGALNQEITSNEIQFINEQLANLTLE